VSLTIDEIIQAALCARLQGGSYKGALIAYPFVAFTPTPGVAYIEARSMLRADVNSPALGFNQSDLFAGIFQVDALIPDGGGETPGIRLAALVAARFYEGTKIALSTGRYLKINKIPSIAAAVKDAPWIRFPVSIPYLVID
jgi:hypothetical protein